MSARLNLRSRKSLNVSPSRFPGKQSIHTSNPPTTNQGTTSQQTQPAPVPTRRTTRQRSIKQFTTQSTSPVELINSTQLIQQLQHDSTPQDNDSTPSTNTAPQPSDIQPSTAQPLGTAPQSPVRCRRAPFTDSDSAEWKQHASRLIVNKKTLLQSRDNETIGLLPTQYKSLHALLPSHYLSLYIQFNALETVMCLSRSKSTQYYRNVVPSVQNISHRNFSKIQLGQIITVYPEAYEISECTYIDEYRTQCHDLRIVRLDTHTDKTSSSTIQHVGTDILELRKQQFILNLYDLCVQHHMTWCIQHEISCDPQLYGINTGKWHSLYDTDSVPQIEPVIVDNKLNKPTSITTLLELTTRKQPIIRASTGTADRIQPNKTLTPVKRKYNNRDLDLLDDNIFQLLQKNQQQNMIDNHGMTHEQQHELTVLDKLCKLYTLIKNVLLGEKKMTMRYNDLIKLLSSCNREFTDTVQLKSMMARLIDIIPEYISIKRIGHGSESRDVVITKSVDNNTILNKLQQYKLQQTNLLYGTTNTTTATTQSSTSDTNDTDPIKSPVKKLVFDDCSDTMKPPSTILKHDIVTPSATNNKPTPAKRSLGLGLSAVINNTTNTPVIKKSGLSSMR